jgi:hypothetical protein
MIVPTATRITGTEIVLCPYLRQRGRFMHVLEPKFRVVVFLASIPVALFAIYVACLVVPLVVREVVPAVVRSIVG